MRLYNVKLVCFMGLLIGFALFVGCGAQDLLDEEGTRIVAFATPQDGDDDTNDIDVVSVDCDDNATTDDAEGLFDFNVKITIESDLTAAEFYVHGYDVILERKSGTYLESSTATWTGLTAVEIPSLLDTVLNPISYDIGTTVVLPGATVTLDGLLVWTGGQKALYESSVVRNDPSGLFNGFLGVTAGGFSVFESENTDFVYGMHVILHCTDIENNEFTVRTADFPVDFSNVDNC